MQKERKIISKNQGLHLEKSLEVYSWKTWFIKNRKILDYCRNLIYFELK